MDAFHVVVRREFTLYEWLAIENLHKGIYERAGLPVSEREFQLSKAPSYDVFIENRQADLWEGDDGD